MLPDLKGLWRGVHFRQEYKRKPPSQKVRRLLFPLFPLDGFSSAVTSFQSHPVFGAVSSRVPSSNTVSYFVGLGDKSRDNFKNFFQTLGFEFLFLSQSARRTAFGSSIASKTPVLKLNRPLVCKPPAAIASESTQMACRRFAKPTLL